MALPVHCFSPFFLFTVTMCLYTSSPSICNALDCICSPLFCSLQHPRSRTRISTCFPSHTTTVKRCFKPSSIAALATPNYGRLLWGWRDMVKWGHFAEGYLQQQCGSSQEWARSAVSAVVWAGWVNVISNCVGTTSSQRQEESHREWGGRVIWFFPLHTGVSSCTPELTTDVLPWRTISFHSAASLRLLLSQEAWLFLAKFSHQCFLASSSC